MKTKNNLLVACALIVACVILGTPAIFGQDDKKSSVNVKYDKKKDLTTVRLKPFRITNLILEKEAMKSVPLHQTDLEISYEFAGQQASKVDSVTFRFSVTASNYIFLRSQTAMAVLDNEQEGKGRAFAIGESDYKSFPPEFNTVFKETMVVAAPAEALARMAKANSLQIYLGPVGYAISEKQLGAIKELAAMLPATTAAQQ